MSGDELEALLPETDGFPVGQGITIIRGKTLAKTSQWLKAILLVDVGQKRQLRFYGWQKDKEGNYKVRQKFNVSKSYSATIAEIMAAFYSSEK